MRSFLLKCYLALAVFLSFPLWGDVKSTLQEAALSYQRGEKASTYEEQKKAFNHALSLYHLAEQQQRAADPLLDQALADTYFQLGEYAWAILYYQRALKKAPSSFARFSALEKAQQKLGIPPSSPSFFSYSFFSFPVQWMLFTWITFLAFIFCSLAIWFALAWIRWGAVVSIIFTILGLGQLLFLHYSTPVEGIIVSASGLYREPQASAPQLTQEPLLAGSKVAILHMAAEGNWLKISTSTGLIGYIPLASLRLIE